MSQLHIALILNLMILPFTLGLVNQGSSSKASAELTEILKTYDRRVRPFANNGSAGVNLQISFVTIGPINEKDFTFRTDYFMRQWWTDDRLKLSEGEVKFNGNPKNLIWLPDLFIRNSRQTIKHSGLTDTIRTTIYNDGKVYMSSRISAICSCNMKLQKYPMDHQICKLIFESYAYDGHDLNISWHKTPVEYKKTEIQIEGYELQKVTSATNVVTYVTGEFFPLLEIHVHVQRTVSYYIFRSYVPSSFLVVMTWGTFWLPATTYPARVGIIVTNFLASAFILQGASSMYTKVPYTTAIEVYLLVNITFILAVMLEYIAVIQIPDFKRKQKQSAESPKSTDIELLPNGQKKEQNKPPETVKKPNVHILDRTSRFIFPTAYLLFLVTYFIRYQKEID